MDMVGFLSAVLAKGAEVVMNRFLHSHSWYHWVSTLVWGSWPILVAPTSWIISPPREIPPTQVTRPPAAVMISWNVSCMCLAFFFFNDPETTEIYTLSLPDSLPI